VPITSSSTACSKRFRTISALDPLLLHWPFGQ
jgi:hypothetical protein